jgi:hypothetical protein
MRARPNVMPRRRHYPLHELLRALPPPSSMRSPRLPPSLALLRHRSLAVYTPPLPRPVSPPQLGSSPCCRRRPLCTAPSHRPALLRCWVCLRAMTTAARPGPPLPPPTSVRYRTLRLGPPPPPSASGAPPSTTAQPSSAMAWPPATASALLDAALLNTVAPTPCLLDAIRPPRHRPLEGNEAGGTLFCLLRQYYQIHDFALSTVNRNIRSEVPCFCSSKLIISSCYRAKSYR